MMKKLSILILEFTLGLITGSLLFMLCGCSSSIPALAQEQMLEDLETVLTENQYAYDSLSKVHFEEMETAQEDLERLKTMFQSRVEYKSIQASFVMKSLQKEVEARYVLIYAYNSEWKCMFSHPLDEAQWVYESREGVTQRQMLSDLQKVEFEGFEKGYIGQDKTTALSIRGRDQRIEEGIDDIKAVLQVKTDFASYSIDVSFQYVFDEGLWKAEDIRVQDYEFWTVDFAAEKIPSAPNVETVRKYLTDPNNFLTYVVNPSYAAKCTLVQNSRLSSADSLIYRYTMTVEYKDFCTVEYAVSIPYEWTDGEWSSGDIEVNVGEVDISPLLGVWKSSGKDWIEFVSLAREEGSSLEHENLIDGIYHRQTADGEFEYKFRCRINIPLRDNNWELIVRQWEVGSTESVEFKLDRIVLDTKERRLKAGEQIFIRTEQKQQAADDANKQSSESRMNETSSEGNQSQSSASSQSLSESSAVSSEKSSPASFLQPVS